MQKHHKPRASLFDLYRQSEVAAGKPLLLEICLQMSPLVKPPRGCKKLSGMARDAGGRATFLLKAPARAALTLMSQINKRPLCWATPSFLMLTAGCLNLPSIVAWEGANGHGELSWTAKLLADRSSSSFHHHQLIQSGWPQPSSPLSQCSTDTSADTLVLDG